MFLANAQVTRILLGYKNIFPGFVIVGHVLVQVVFTTTCRKHNLIFILVDYRRVVFIFRIDLASDIHNGKILRAGDKFFSVLAFKNRAVNRRQIYFILSLVVRLFGQLVFILVEVLDGLVEVLSVLIALADGVFDIKAIVGILAQYAKKILRREIFP